MFYGLSRSEQYGVECRRALEFFDTFLALLD
jgi:hypothetical protein